MEIEQAQSNCNGYQPLRATGVRGSFIGQMDLFGSLIAGVGRYPYAPGHKTKDGPSPEAARKIHIYAGSLRAEVLNAFRALGDGGASADEIAKLIGSTILGVRPRVSELARAGLVIPLADRRGKNESGMSATIWRAATTDGTR